MKRVHLVLAAGVMGLVGMIGNASAHDIGFTISAGSPVHYGQPAHVVRHAVAYGPPPVAYHRPAPAHYGNPVFIGYNDRRQHQFAHQHRGFHPGWQGHHGR